MSRLVKSHRLALVGALALFAAACGNQEQGGGSASAPASESPDAAVAHSIQLLRKGDFNALVEASVPPSQLEQAKAHWMNEFKKEEVTDESRAEFAETMAKLTAPDAEEQMMAEIRPQLEQFQGEMRAQLPAMVAMGKGFVLAAIDESEDIKPENKPQVTNLVNALGTWAESGEFANIDRAETAVAEITAAARKMPVRTLDELHALDFNGMMNAVSIGYGGLKGVLKAYDIDMDATLENARVETISQEGDNAKVRVHIEFLGAPLNFDTELVRVDGRWYGKDTLANLDKLMVDQESTTDAS